MTSDLRYLLDPESLVIVGASPNFSRTGGIPVEHHLPAFPPEALLLVNPKYKEIAGRPCYPDIASLPYAPELAVLAIRAQDVLAMLQDCHARGIKAAVLFASGFAEEGGELATRMQEDIARFARETGMTVSGPNCLGHANFRLGVYPTFLKNMAGRTPGPVAVVAQSGNMASVMMHSAQQAGIGLSYLVNTGNEACTELSQFVEHFAEDPHTEAVLAYVEQLRDGPRLMHAVSRLRDAGKPMFVMKSGVSDKGAQAAASHTAAMAGSAIAYATAFRQMGIATATDPYRLTDLAYLWRFGRRTKAKRVCIVSVSGAACALLADGFSAASIAVPTLADETQAALRKVVPSYGMVSNPIDLTGQVTNDSTLLGPALEAIISSTEIDAIVLYVMGYLLDQMAPDLIAAAARTDKLVVVIDTSNATSKESLEHGGIAVFKDMDRAVTATAGYLQWSQSQHGEQWSPASARAAVASPQQVVVARAQGRQMLNEVEAKQLLAKAGLPMVPEIIATSADGAARAQSEFGGRVAIKILSPDIAHKSEIGGVMLGIATPDEAHAAYTTLIANARQHEPEARLDGVVVQPMILEGQSVLIGITRDPVFGHMMTVGLGGILTELYQDVAHRILPITPRMADDMLRELRSFPLLDGYRGAAPVDRENLVRMMVALSDFVGTYGDDFEEIELNPVMVRPGNDGVMAVDALVRLSTRSSANKTQEEKK